MSKDQNPKNIEKILDSDFGSRRILFNYKFESENGRDLFRKRILKILIKNEVYTVDQQLLRDLRHISDYVKYCEAENAIDRIRSLVGMPDLKKMIETIDAFFEKLQEEALLNEDPQSLKIVHELEHNFRIVELTKSEQLQREGKIMQHCVGTYYHDVSQGRCRILSLRDPNNKPHCTIEVVENEITQFQGKQNKAPVEKYRPLLQDFLLKSNLYARQWLISELELIRVDEKIYRYEDLPDDLTVKGSLKLGSLALGKLPAKLNIGGDLMLKYSKVESLPQNLIVGGDLDISYSDIKSLPENLKVGGRLWLGGADDLEIPASIEVEEHIYINEANIKPLPDNFIIKGGLSLQESPLKELPKGLKVGKSLNIRGSNISKLPKDLYVGGDIDLHDSKVKNLPEGLHVDGDLMFDHAPFSEIPEDIFVGGSLFLQYAKVKKLPKNFNVGNKLFVNGCPLEELPENLTVEGSCNVSDTPLTGLPKGFKVGGTLDISNTKIIDLPPDLVCYSLKVDGTKLSNIPETIEIKWKIILNDIEMDIEEFNKI